jgi:SAM-dependent methyltransferase
MELNPGGSIAPPKLTSSSLIREYKRAGHHYKKFLFAESRVARKKILDFGCGYGIAGLVLGERCAEYVGVDVDPLAVQFAKGLPQRPGSRIRYLSLTEFEHAYPDAYFDVGLSIEVIEHIDLALASEYLQSLSRKVRSKGTVILTTPNGSFARGNSALYRCEFHRHEYNAAELENVLSPFFSEFRWFEERRWDHLDRFMIRKFLQLQQEGRHPSESGRPRNSPSKERWFNLLRWFVNSRLLWRMKPSIPSKMMKPDFTSIVVECVR